MTTTRRNGIVLLIGLGLAGAGAAQALTDAEFKCQAKVSKAATKFIAAKGTCARRCVGEAARALHPWADCAPPFAGAMAECVAGPTGAEAKFEAAIMNACDPSTRAGTDCPECYDGGDCGIGGEASDRMQNVEGQLDAVGAGIYCNVANGTAAERTCETNTAKALAKLTGAIGKCYDKCHASARRGIVVASTCAPPASDATTAACVSVADQKTIARIDRKCADVGALPDCAATDDYPTGSAWVNLVDLAVSGNVPGTYCQSPSGAFVE
jgi:hypothetical protein